MKVDEGHIVDEGGTQLISPDNSVEACQTSSQDIELTEVADSPTSPTSVAAWLGRLNGTQVQVPPNGQCLYYAFTQRQQM